MIRETRGNMKVEVLPFLLPKTASEAFDKNDIVTLNAAGTLTKVGITAAPRTKLYQMVKDVLATDSDYASATPIEVGRVDANGLYMKADVTTGTAVASMVGQVVSLASATGLDLKNKGQGCFYIDQVLSTKVVVGHFVTTEPEAKLRSIKQTFVKADFTDGTAAVGTVVMGAAIPLGAVVTRTLLTDVVAFSGDTSAVAILGDGTDTDRYNTGTPSLFATAASVDAGAVSGTAYHAAAITPTLTVTTGSDFTALPATASVTVTVFFYAAV